MDWDQLPDMVSSSALPPLETVERRIADLVQRAQSEATAAELSDAEVDRLLFSRVKGALTEPELMTLAWKSMQEQIQEVAFAIQPKTGLPWFLPATPTSMKRFDLCTPAEVADYLVNPAEYDRFEPSVRVRLAQFAGVRIITVSGGEAGEYWEIDLEDLPPELLADPRPE